MGFASHQRRTKAMAVASRKIFSENIASVFMLITETGNFSSQWFRFRGPSILIFHSPLKEFSCGIRVVDGPERRSVISGPFPSASNELLSFIIRLFHFERAQQRNFPEKYSPNLTRVSRNIMKSRQRSIGHVFCARNKLLEVFFTRFP